MPTRPPIACPSCGAAVPVGADCPTCGPRRLRLPPRPPPRSVGYSKAWDRYSQDWRARFPFCGQRSDGAYAQEHSACVRAGRFHTLARLVDHIRPISDGGDMWDETNHQSLCHSCHVAKTRAEHTARSGKFGKFPPRRRAL